MLCLQQAAVAYSVPMPTPTYSNCVLLGPEVAHTMLDPTQHLRRAIRMHTGLAEVMCYEYMSIKDATEACRPLQITTLQHSLPTGPC